MIEIGETTDARLTYAEAVMYCFCLGDGWRLPTRHEYFNTDEAMAFSWYNGKQSTSLRPVTPVRDLKDD